MDFPCTPFRNLLGNLRGLRKVGYKYRVTFLGDLRLAENAVEVLMYLQVEVVVVTLMSGLIGFRVYVEYCPHPVTVCIRVPIQGYI